MGFEVKYWIKLLKSYADVVFLNISIIEIYNKQ